MLQKTIWKAFLIIGIISTCFCLFQGCKKRIDRIKTIDYIYVNKSGYDLEMRVLNANKTQIKCFPISNNSQIISHTSNCEVPAVLQFDNVIDMTGDSVIILFDDNRSLHYSRHHAEDEHGDRIFDCRKYDNYSEELLSEDAFSLYYTFTKEDHDNAIQAGQ